MHGSSPGCHENQRTGRALLLFTGITTETAEGAVELVVTSGDDKEDAADDGDDCDDGYWRKEPHY